MTTLDLAALTLAAPRVDARARERASSEMGEPPTGVLVLRTCHRLEVLGSAADVATVRGMAGARRLDGEEAARHLLRVAVGLESTVLAEDQILHQLRAASREARARGAMPPAVGRLVDTALHHGRRARSWLPAQRPSLADVALDRVGARTLRAGDRVTVVGRGPMGRGLAHAVTARGGEASQVGRDGGPIAGGVGVAIALAGPWRPPAGSLATLLDGDAWVIDLSAPSALDGETLRRLGSRVVTIDDLGDATSAARDVGGRLRERLELLAEQALEDCRSWADAQAAHGLAGVRVSQAGEARARELEALWRRLPDLAPGQRAEIERMAERLSERLLFGL